ncbi:hypothetical protein HYC85_031324, partial [Camellia sinensis]
DNLVEEAASGGSAGKSFRERDKEGFSTSAVCYSKWDCAINEQMSILQLRHPVTKTEQLISSLSLPLSLSRQWKVDSPCSSTICYSTPSEIYVLPQILPLPQSGFTQSSGGSCLGTTLLQSGTMEVAHLIAPRATKGIYKNYDKPNWILIILSSELGFCFGILVWKDGFCDFYECERAGNVKGRFGADVFFKTSHEVYSYGEGMVGKVAADNSHKWVFKDNPSENDSSFITSWNVSIDPQPRAWQFQFHSGIQTIALISIREGIIQFHSFDKIIEDLNLVISIQRKFSYIQRIPGIYAIQRPYQFQPIQYPYTFKPINNHAAFESHDDKCHHLTGTKRLLYDGK